MNCRFQIYLYAARGIDLNLLIIAEKHSVSGDHLILFSA